MPKLRLLSTVILAMALSACDSGGANDETPDDIPQEVIQKSPKRGIAYDIRQPADLEAVREGVSWWYNWGESSPITDATAEQHQALYLPMLWGHESTAEFEQVKAYILARPDVEYLLVMNEPNLTDQANMTPQRAAEEWVKYEQLVAEIEATGRSIKIVGPQMTWGTMTGLADPVFWLDQFHAWYGAANGGREPRIDYLGFHWYDYGLEQQLDRLQKYGKQIWVTEMANWNENIDTVEKQIEQMTQMVALLESRADIFRYAWFTGRWSNDPHHTSIFDAGTGQLTALGEAYLALPY